MKYKKTSLLALLSAVILLPSCAANNALIAPARLNSTAYKTVIDCDEAFASYNAFAKKATASKALEGEGNSVYSPFSHYLTMAAALYCAEGVDKDSYAQLGAKDAEELASTIDKLVKMETIAQNNASVEIANLVGNFDRPWPQEKVNNLVEKLHMAYIDQYSGHESAISNWRKELSNGMIQGDFNSTLPDHFITFLGGLYLDLPYQLALNQGVENRPFNGEGSYPFLTGETYGILFQDNDEVLAFRLICKGECAIDFVMPKEESLDEYLSTHDYRSCFDEETLLYNKYVFEMPSIEISEELRLESISRDAGIKLGSFPFVPNEVPYELVEQSQKLSLAFRYNGVKAYVETKAYSIPASMAMGSVYLNKPFAFDVVGRKGATIIHGRVRTLEK